MVICSKTLSDQAHPVLLFNKVPISKTLNQKKTFLSINVRDNDLNIVKKPSNQNPQKSMKGVTIELPNALL